MHSRLRDFIADNKYPLIVVGLCLAGVGSQSTEIYKWITALSFGWMVRWWLDN